MKRISITITVRGKTKAGEFLLVKIQDALLKVAYVCPGLVPGRPEDLITHVWIDVRIPARPDVPHPLLQPGVNTVQWKHGKGSFHQSLNPAGSIIGGDAGKQPDIKIWEK